MTLCARNAHTTVYDVTTWSAVNLVNPSSLLRYEKSISMTSAILISKVQQCPTSSGPSPSVFILEAIKNWRRERPGNEATFLYCAIKTWRRERPGNEAISRFMKQISLVPRPEEVCVHELNDSALTRSTAVGILMACPHDDRAPLMDWIAERRREKASSVHAFCSRTRAPTPEAPKTRMYARCMVVRVYIIYGCINHLPHKHYIGFHILSYS